MTFLINMYIQISRTGGRPTALDTDAVTVLHSLATTHTHSPARQLNCVSQKRQHVCVSGQSGQSQFAQCAHHHRQPRGRATRAHDDPGTQLHKTRPRASVCVFYVCPSVLHRVRTVRTARANAGGQRTRAVCERCKRSGCVYVTNSTTARSRTCTITQP